MFDTRLIPIGFSFAFELIAFSIPYLIMIPKKKKNIKYLPFLLIVYFSLGFSLELFRNYISTNSFLLDVLIKSLSYFLNIGLLCCLGYFVIDENLISTLIISVIAYCTQHFTYDLVKGQLLIIDASMNTGNYTLYYLIYIPLSILVCVGSYFLLKKRMFFLKEKRFNSKWLIISTLSLLFVIVMNLLGEQVLDNTAKIYLLIYDLIGTILFISLFFYNIRLVAEEEEKIILKKTWEEKMKYYEMSKTTINELNRHYHDMKHLLVSLDKNIIPSEEISNKLSLYNHLFKTGNESLDVVLNTKSLYCLDNNITLSCMADGKSLDFLSSRDIYILFGNILDNAIEAVMKCEDTNKKYISLNVSVAKGGIHISEENYFVSPVEEKDNSLKTTKNSEMFHGIGTKSIYLICKEYSGIINYKTDGDLFYIDIFFPR